MAEDLIQVTREAIVAVVDSHADIVAITGRDAENIVAWNPDAPVERPVVAYQFITGSQRAADGDTRSLLFQFSASAHTEAEANELLGVVERILTQSAFLSLSNPLDAFVERSTRRGFDLDITLQVSRSTLIPA
jgi:hypothetical protein